VPNFNLWSLAVFIGIHVERRPMFLSTEVVSEFGRVIEIHCCFGVECIFPSFIPESVIGIISRPSGEFCLDSPGGKLYK
jgi:hypothetical protein